MPLCCHSFFVQYPPFFCNLNGQKKKNHTYKMIEIMHDAVQDHLVRICVLTQRREEEKQEAKKKGAPKDKRRDSNTSGILAFFFIIISSCVFFDCI